MEIKFLNYLKLKTNYYLPSFDNSSCDSINVIYIICCKLSNAFYIGQTSRSVKKRINEHIYSINSFIPFHDKNTCVSIHFNLKPHNY